MTERDCGHRKIDKFAVFVDKSSNTTLRNYCIVQSWKQGREIV